jgi:hypothetical protein
VLLSAGAGRRLGLVDTLAALMPDHGGSTPITHSMADVLHAAILALKSACGQLPESGARMTAVADQEFGAGGLVGEFGSEPGP